jgi:predicted metal-binding membrane protein
MQDAFLETMLRRDRAIVGLALAALTLLAWAYLLWVAALEPGGATMPMSAGMAMAPMSSGSPLTAFAFTFAMWAVMMVGMMTPSATPMILLYARVGRQGAAAGSPIAATGFFAGGYLLAWTAFAIAAAAAQRTLEEALLMTPEMASASRPLSGLILIGAGLYQWTSAKDACLRNCQSPLAFLHRNGGFRRDPLGALALGARHGLYCIGCCFALMAVLFVVGIMNLLWVAVLAAFVLVEKLAVTGVRLSRAAGILLAIAGVWLLVSS